MENNESPYILLTWLQSGSEEMQLSALEQLCLALLQYETNEALVKFYPPSMYVPVLSCLCQDFDISFLLLEAIIRTLTYYMQAVPHEVINSLVNTKGTLMAICMRLENPNMDVSIESDLTQQIMKLLEELCKRDTKSLSNIGGACYIINYLSRTHQIIHLDTIKSGFYILYKIIDKIDPSDKRLGDWFLFLSNFLKHSDNRIVEYSLHCLFMIIKLCNEKKISTEPLGIEEIIDDLLEMIILQLKTDSGHPEDQPSRSDSVAPSTSNKIGLSKTIIELMLCIIRGSTHFLCNLLVNNKLSDILLEIITQYESASMSIIQLIEGIYEQIYERISYHSDEFSINLKAMNLFGFKIVHGRIFSEDMFQQHARYHECLMKAISDGNIETLKELLLSTDFDSRFKDKFGQTPLNLACALGLVEGVNLLLARGVDPNLGEKASSFHYASSQGHLLVLEALLKNEGLDSSMKDWEGVTIIDRMREFVEKSENLVKISAMKSLISKIESQYSELSPEILRAKEYFVKRMIPVLINMYFKNNRNSVRFTILELIGNAVRSFNTKDHEILLKEEFQGYLLPYHISKMLYRVFLLDSGENVLKAIELSLYLTMDLKYSKTYLKWFYRMGVKDVLEKSIDNFASISCFADVSECPEMVIPLHYDVRFSEYTITNVVRSHCLNVRQAYYWGDWNILGEENGLNLYNEYCYVFVANNQSPRSVNILMKKDTDLEKTPKKSQRNNLKNQLFTHFTKCNALKYPSEEKSPIDATEGNSKVSFSSNSDYEVVEIISTNVRNRPDLAKELLEKYSSVLASLQPVSMPVPFPRLLPGKFIYLKDFRISSFSNHLKISRGSMDDKILVPQTSIQAQNEITEDPLDEESEFMEISINKISGFVLRSVDQIFYRTGALHRQGGFKRLEPLKSVTDRIRESKKHDNSARDSICQRIVSNGRHQLDLLKDFQNLQNKFFKNVSNLRNAIKNHKKIDIFILNMDKLFSSDTTRPTPYELRKSHFLTVLTELLQDEGHLATFGFLFKENLPRLTKMTIQLLEQIENLPTSHQQHSYISEHYLTRALHMRAVLNNCNDNGRFDVDPIPDLSKYNFLVMPLSSPRSIKTTVNNLIQKLPWYRADKLSFNSIRQLKTDPFFVEIKFEGRDMQAGFFHWLGTNGFHSTFINPLKLNLISVSLSENSSNLFNSPYNLFMCRSNTTKGVSNKTFVSIPGPHSYLTIHLKHPFGFIPTAYILGRPLIEESGTFCLINWQLMASIDGIEWDILHIHMNDRHLIESNNGRYLWSFNIERSLLEKVKDQGWTIFKIQELEPKDLISESIIEKKDEVIFHDRYVSNDNNFQTPSSGGFWLNYIEFYGTVYAISDRRQEEIKSSIDSYLSKFKVGTLVQPAPHSVYSNNGGFLVGKIVSSIKAGTTLVEWDGEFGKSHIRHKMGSQGKYELTLMQPTNDSLVKSSDPRPKTTTESFIESKSSFEIRPESREDVRYSFQDSISWVIDPNISAPLRTSSLSSQRNNRFPSFFNKENLVENIVNKEVQSIYKKRRDAIKDYQDYNTLIKSETEDMDLRCENSDEENLHLESTTVRSYIQSRMDYLDGVSGASKPTIRFSEKYPTEEEGNIYELPKKKNNLPEESKKNFSLSKETKRRNSVVLSEGRRDTVKIMDNIEEVEISDDSEYLEISQETSRFMKQGPRLETESEINRNKPYLDRKYYSSFMKNRKYKPNFPGPVESNTKFKPINIPHSFPGLVQCIDPKAVQVSSEIRSNIEVLNYRANKASCMPEETSKSKNFGYDQSQFQMKLEIEIPVPAKCNFNIQKPTDPDLAREIVEGGHSDVCKQSGTKRTLEVILNPESDLPIINYVLAMLPAPDPIVNMYPVDSISQLWHSQSTLYYGFCDKKNDNNCKKCFYEKKLNDCKSKKNNDGLICDDVTEIINVINTLKNVQLIINRKLSEINEIEWKEVVWGDSCFISQQISKTLLNQLEDVWSLLSKDDLPLWVLEWPQKYPFMFSYEVRVDILNAYWLGPSRSIFWLQQKIRPNIDYVRPTFREEIPSPFHFLGRLKKHIARVPRPSYFGNTNVKENEARATFWGAVKDLFRFHSENKEELEIQFELEEGTGIGPTLEFMNILSNEFMKIDTFMWIHNDSSSVYTGGLVFSENGLFPYPWPEGKLSEDVLERFHILGIFIAKCLQDNRRIDIPFSETFIKLLIGGIPVYNEGAYLEGFCYVYPMRGRFLKSLLEFCTKKDAFIKERCENPGESNENEEQLKTLAIETLGDTFDNLCIDMEFLPTSKIYAMAPYPLITIPEEDTEINNERRYAFNEPLSASNAEAYVKETLMFTMSYGIEKQITAMKDGFNRVFPIQSLRMFTAVELKHLLCGEQDIKWTLEELYQFTEPTQGYTKSSQNYKYFIEVLDEMTQVERKIFIQFVTGCTSLPPGGLRNMKPRLAVAKKNAKDGGPYPSVNTCMHYLKLPEYISKNELKSKLMDASSQQGFHLN